MDYCIPPNRSFILPNPFLGPVTLEFEKRPTPELETEKAEQIHFLSYMVMPFPPYRLSTQELAFPSYEDQAFNRLFDLINR